jgi:hypothetical protein
LIGKLKTWVGRPYLAAPLSLLLAASPAFCAWAAPDSSGLKGFGQWVLAGGLFFAAIAAIFLIVWGIIGIRGDDYGGGVIKVAIGVVAAVIVGFGVVWVNGLTGQNIQPGNF